MNLSLLFKILNLFYFFIYVCLCEKSIRHDPVLLQLHLRCINVKYSQNKYVIYYVLLLFSNARHLAMQSFVLLHSNIFRKWFHLGGLDILRGDRNPFLHLNCTMGRWGTEGL